MKNPLALFCAAALLNIFLCLAPGGLNDMHAAKVAAPTKVIHVPVTPARWQTVEWLVYTQTGAAPAFPDGTTDALYFFPTHKQLTEMDKVVRPKLHLEYIDEAWDCESMAQEWRVLCQRWAIDHLTKKAPIAIAAFIAHVRIYPEAFDGRFGVEGLHALGMIIDNEGISWYVDVQSGWHVKVEEAKYEGSIECFKIIF